MEGNFMTTLAWVHSAFLLIHILCVLALVGLLLQQLKKSPRVLHSGIPHIAATALLAGLVMVGIRPALHTQDANKWPDLNNSWVGAKFLVLIIVLVLAYKNVKKTELKKSTWLTIVGLVTLNFLMALFWK